MEFETIYQDYADTVYRFLLNLTGNEQTAEELTQECFYRAYKSIRTYSGKCKLSVWLCQIAKNLYFDECRKKKFQPLNDLQAEDSFSFEILLENQDSAKQIHMILHHLEEPYKEVFTLKVFGELSYKDIAGLFGKTESWARVTYYRAKLKIAECL
ncbi:RNA polymerase sigma factor [Candidatus Soleaferrea massiliensis]|uniref:RNA polymerase sigma factor n=1 Tax=Candidatus Soleaferrea massiliensis TaxID=1470354 RepID=UPI00058C3C37|nr:RNA polymerase sigma factor [Candidatus Soleaferrea massiliensis]